MGCYVPSMGIEEGQKIHRWLVLGTGKPDRFHNRRWLCRCDCGTEKQVSGYYLKTGRSRSCGCLRDESVAKHGMCDTRVYKIWEMMNQRCHNPNYDGYENYGGRGIAVCKRWRGPGGFLRFYDHVKDPPSKRHTLDRIDNDGDYKPGNVRWSTLNQQSRNRSNNTRYTVNGETMILADWAKRLGTKPQTICSRLNSGWGIEAALTVPVRRS